MMLSRFQSTHSEGGTVNVGGASVVEYFSIHPPRAGWDPHDDAGNIPGGYFNPPTPSGVGRSRLMRRESYDYFNPPTPSGVGPISPLLLGVLK